jgi:hypothetical protein
MSSKFSMILYSKTTAAYYFLFYPSQPNYFFLKIQDQNICLNPPPPSFQGKLFLLIFLVSAGNLRMSCFLHFFPVLAFRILDIILTPYSIFRNYSTMLLIHIKLKLNSRCTFYEITDSTTCKSFVVFLDVREFEIYFLIWFLSLSFSISGSTVDLSLDMVVVSSSIVIL